MAAAYAAVVSLMNILEQIRNHPRLSTCFDNNQIQSLAENLDCLLALIESVRGASSQVEDLQRQIASAAYAAEDVIESHVVDQIHAGFPEIGPISLIDLQKIIQDMSLIIKEEVAKVEEERPYRGVQQPRPAAAPDGRLSSGRNTMVGFDDVLLQLLDRLTGGRRHLEIIPIVGAPGIGKTTLAKNSYDHPLIKEHFDVRAWVTVSQDYNVRGLLRELLSSCMRGYTDELAQLTENQLGERLYIYLSGRRYLIVLDDMWNVKSWDMIKRFLPDNGNGSRIIITTWLSGLASQFNSSGLVINFLDEYESWELFCRTVFIDRDVPLELEEIGKIIARSCKGIPLSITVVGGLLRNSSMTLEYWKHVAENIGSILYSDEDNQLHNILMLSYNALPAYLKPCFLYLGIFPDNHEFRVSQIIKLWVAEGFLKPHQNLTFEDIGEGCIKELIDWNLILVTSTRSDGKPKSCKFHKLPNRDDLVQNLKFSHSLRKLVLQDCELHWDDLSIVGSLPNLQVLKLKCQSVRGPKWETAEGEFPSLRMLEIDSCYLIYWFSEVTHFPSLEKLVLRRLYRLNEIPAEMGEIPTLQYICVVECSISAAISAVRILQKQEELYGESDYIQVRVKFRKEKEVAEFTAKVGSKGYTSHNLQIDGV